MASDDSFEEQDNNPLARRMPGRMEAVQVPHSSPISAPLRSARSFTWLTPFRCRAIFIAIIAFGLLSHLRYLAHDCPIDLSGDEAQYWDWSRALDWSYYSKGPLIAYIIRASCAIFGDVMWAVRLPALLFAVATSVLTYWLTLRLFRSDRLALGVVLLNHVVPMFVAGSLLMTIDPPYFFCWGLACAFLALAVLDERKWAWIGVGVAVGVGALAKYGTLLWPIGMFAFLLIDPGSRKWLATPWPWLAVLIAVPFLTPPVVWNVKHDWVTFKHVAKQTGAATQDRWLNGNFFEFVGSQIGVLGPALAVILVGAIVFAFRRRLAFSPSPTSADERISRERPSPLAGEGRGEGLRGSTNRADRAVVFLLWMGLPLFLLCTLGSIRSKMQVNWPAAAYFSWMILLAYFLATRLESVGSWRRWRWWFWGAVVFGAAFAPIAHDSSLLYPLISTLNKFKKGKPITAQSIDITYKLKGWRQLGERVSRELKSLNNPMVIGDDYMKTAELAFYVENQPKTYCIGAYIADPHDRKRRTQYDVWPDRNLNQPSLRGRDAIFVGYDPKDLHTAFESVERLPDEVITQRGQWVRRFEVFRCRNFKGLEMKEPGGGF
jgi:4-amino-4-deoxy-L-arabinose transferase-like glycosyltransferase